MAKAGWVGGIFAVLVVGVLLYTSLRIEQVTCEVCVEFNGRTQCRIASGANKEGTVQTAHDNACAFLVGSKTEGFLCGQARPTKVSCQEP